MCRPLADVLAVLLAPVLERLAGRVTIPISIDTYKADVARAALDRGASLVNDVSALRYDPALAGVVAESGAAVILMHNRGRSSDMYRDAQYEDAVAEVGIALHNGLGTARDEREALVWLNRAASMGSAAAMDELGAMYHEGHGVKRDDAVAFDWYKRAAGRGSARAANAMGQAYRNGQGVPIDAREAVNG